MTKALSRSALKLSERGAAKPRTNPGGELTERDEENAVDSALTAEHMIGESTGLKEAAQHVLDKATNAWRCDDEEEASLLKALAKELDVLSQKKREEWEKYKTEYKIELARFNKLVNPPK